MQVPFTPLKGADAPKFNPYDHVELQNALRGETLQHFAWRAQVAQYKYTLGQKQNNAREYTPQAYALAHGLQYVKVSDPFLRALGARTFQANIDVAGRLQQILITPHLGTLKLQDQDQSLFTVLNEALQRLNKVKRRLGYRTMDLEVSRVTHVNRLKLHQEAQPLFALAQSMSIGTNGIRSRAHGEDTGTSFTFSPLAPIFRFTELITWGTLSYNITRSQGNNDSEIEQGVLSIGNSPGVIAPTAFDLDTVNSTACLQVTARSPRIAQGLYICTDPIPSLRVQELYTHVYTTGVDSSKTRAYDPATQDINRDLRGEVEFSGLIWALRSALESHNDQAIFPAQFVREADAFFRARTLSYPSLNIIPVVMDSTNVPHVIDNFVPGYKQEFVDGRAFGR